MYTHIRHDFKLKENEQQNTMTDIQPSALPAQYCIVTNLSNWLTDLLTWTTTTTNNNNASQHVELNNGIEKFSIKVHIKYMTIKVWKTQF